MNAALKYQSTTHVYRGAATIDEGKRMAAEMLAHPFRCTAVICSNNLFAVGCLRVFNTHHITVPHDISLITFDEYPFAKFTDPPLTTVGIDVHNLGVQAGTLLLNKIKKPSLYVQSYSTLPVLEVRASDKVLG